MIKDWEGLAQSLHSMSTLFQNKASWHEGRLLERDGIMWNLQHVPPPKSRSFKFKSTEQMQHKMHQQKHTHTQTHHCAPAYSDPRQPEDFNQMWENHADDKKWQNAKFTAMKIWDWARFPWWLSGHLWLLEYGSYLTSCTSKWCFHASRTKLTSALKIWHQSNQLHIHVIALLSQSYLSATCTLIKEKKESSQSSLYFANWPLNG